MKIYQLKTPEQFQKDHDDTLTPQELMSAYAEHVAKKFAAECVNMTLGNKMEVSNALHMKIDKLYTEIEYDQ